MKPSIFRRFLLPGFAFQAVIIGGGYASGRELVEFFLSDGPASALAGLAAASVLMSLVCAATFAFARLHRTFEYGGLLRHLLGRGSVVFELVFICNLILVLSVAGATSGEVFKALTGAEVWTGTALFAVFTAAIVFGGSQRVDVLFKYWSLLLYGVYVTLLIMAFTRFGDAIGANVSHSSVEGDWLKGAVRYAGYNLVVAVVVLHTVRSATRTSDAVAAGLLCGPLGMVPAFALLLAMTSQYPQITQAAVPALTLIDALNVGWFAVLYQVTVFGVLVETGVGMVHALIERVAAACEARGTELSKFRRGAAGILVLSASLVGATMLGLVDLIAKGYGTLTYAVLLVFALPVLTLGVWQVLRAPSASLRTDGA